MHDLDCPAGERSPLKALYDLEASVLLLGTTETVGKATSQLLPIRPLVDFATKWFSTHRKH